jgi:hypothetical protein
MEKDVHVIDVGHTGRVQVEDLHTVGVRLEHRSDARHDELTLVDDGDPKRSSRRAGRTQDVPTPDAKRHPRSAPR